MPEEHGAVDPLVTRAQGGDLAAFGLLVERHQDALFNGICRMVGRREDAEDLAQETFLKALRGIPAFQGRSSFYTWLYSIAVNTVISHRRRLGSSRHRSPLSLHEGADPDGSPMEVVDPAPRPEAASELHETHDRISKAIAELDDDHGLVVVMRDIEGFDYETIATLLDCPVGTVKSRLHRARLALRELLKDLVE